LDSHFNRLAEFQILTAEIIDNLIIIILNRSLFGNSLLWLVISFCNVYALRTG